MKRRNTSGNGPASNETAPSCSSCGLTCAGGRVHCPGSTVAYGWREIGYHHGFKFLPFDRQNMGEFRVYENCWRCGGAMGCEICVLAPVCKKCLVVTDREYFISRGPISNDRYSVGTRDGRQAPTFQVYPGAWVTEYALAHPETATRTDDELYEQFKRLAVALIGRPFPGMPTRKTLERRRNRQVEALRIAEKSE